jgi:hypothetical protein
MRIALASAALLLVTTATSVAAAQAPMTQLLASAHGRGSVTISAQTAHLHGRIWLYRHGGTGTANGRTELVCHGAMTAADKGSNIQWFVFRIGPSARTVVWSRAGDDPCLLTVALTGKGLLTVSLRGY